MIAGATQSGKTTLSAKIIQQRHILFSSTPNHVIIFYKNSQPIYNQLKKEGHVDILHQGIPSSIEEIKNILRTFPIESRKLLLIDDFMSEIGEVILELFTRTSNHYNVSVLFLSQNIFYSKYPFRDISLNSHYLIVFKNPRLGIFSYFNF